VTFTNTLTINEHVDRVLSNWAQSVLALKILWAHVLNRECLHNVFNAVILAKLTYGASAWIGFTRASEREIIEAYLSVVAYALNCVLSIQKLLQKYIVYFAQSAANKKKKTNTTTTTMCDIFTTIGFSTISHVICITSSTNYFPLSPQLQQTIILEHANTIGCSHNSLRVSLTLFFIYRALYSDIC